MKYVGITLLCVFGAIVLCAVGLGTSWFGLIASRPMQQYAKETENRVYLNSTAHLQGANSGIAIDCANMRNVSVFLPQRHSFANLVVIDAAGYSGSNPLSSDSETCLAEAKELLSQPLN